MLEILDDMLQFNPHFRSKAGDLLKHSLFDSIRRPELEQPAPFKIKLEVDAPGVFDYESC